MQRDDQHRIDICVDECIRRGIWEPESDSRDGHDSDEDEDQGSPGQGSTLRS